MTTPYPQVVLFGDSLFQGSSETLDGFAFQAALQQHCMRRYDVINRGFSGYNTSQALRALDQIFQPPTEKGPKMAYLIILLGANDAAVPMPKDSQHLPLEKYEKNLKMIVTHPYIQAHKPKILLVTPPPLDEIRMTEVDLAAGYPHATRQAAISASYSEAARRVANGTEGVVLIDLWKELMDVAIAKTPGFDASAANGALLGSPACGIDGHLVKLLPDGLHMSGEAYQIFFETIKPLIEPQHPALSTEGFIFPDWHTAPWLE